MLGLEVANEMRGRVFAFVQSLVRIDLLVVLATAPFLVGVIGSHRIHLRHGSYIRADGVTIVRLVAGIGATIVGLVSFKQMDDRPGMPIWSDLTRSIRRGAA